MICSNCYRSWPAVCYVCDEAAVEPQPVEADSVGVLGGRATDWLHDLYSKGIGWDTLTPDATQAALAYKRGWIREGEWDAVDDAITRVIQAAERAPAARTVSGAHLGSPGERSEHVLQCLSIKPLGPGDYGERFLIVFAGPAGEQVVWFTGEGGKFQPEVGTTYSVTASIKDHSEYQGVKQTIIQRPKGEKHE